MIEETKAGKAMRLAEEMLKEPRIDLTDILEALRDIVMGVPSRGD